MNEINLVDASSQARALSACVSPASYKMPNRLDRNDRWISHAPFAFWLMDVLRPKILVELGVSGYSYAAFCQAVRELNLDCQCYGVDAWNLLHPAYDEQVFQDFPDYIDTHYKDFSHLIRSDFREALSSFDDGSIDLLHISRHQAYESSDQAYAAVRSVFLAWLPRISKSGVILLDGISVHGPGSQLAHVWEELRRDYKHFEFLHGDGIGILAVGEFFPALLEHLFTSFSDPAARQQIQLAYSRLGLSICDRMEHQELSEAKTKIEKLQSELRSKNYFAAVASQRQAELEALKVRHQGETQFYTKKIEDLQNKISIYRKRVRDLKEIAENKSTKYREELRYAHSPRWWLTYPVDFITKHLRK